MAIKSIQIFSPDPAQVSDLGGISASKIFGAPLSRIENMSGQSALNTTAEDFTSPGDDELDSYEPQEVGRPPEAQSMFNPSSPEEAVASRAESMFTTNETSSDFAGGFEDFIFDSEARRDSQGRLQVYKPPSGDGGGAFEVAGITQRYNPTEATRIKNLIERGDHQGAERQVREFFRQRAAPYVRHTKNKGLQLQLADTAHHRGAGGLRSILRGATGSQSKDYGELIRSLDQNPEALNEFNRARRDYEQNKVDRGRSSRAKFRKGLGRRFDNAHAAALKLNSQ